MINSKVKNRTQTALSLHKKGDLLRAREAYKEVLNVSPDDFTALYYLGILEAQCSNNSLAKEYLIKALKQNPANSDALYNVALLYQKSSEWTKALYYYDKCIEINSADEVAFNNKGNVLRELGEWGAAHDCYLKAISINPSYFQAYSNRALSLQKIGRHSEALEVCNKAIYLQPQNAEGYYNLGSILNDLNELQSSSEAYSKAVAYKEVYPEAYYNRGNVLKDLSRFEEALDSYEKAIEQKPEYFEAINNSGVALQELKRFDEALERYDEAIKINSEYAEAYNNKANVLKDLNRFEEALDSYEKAIEQKPEYFEAINNSGVALRELRRFDEALERYDEAIKINSEYADAYVNKALLCLSLGRYLEGWKLYEWRFRKGCLKLSNKVTVTHDSEAAHQFWSKKWKGDASGNPLLLWGEQGVGDQLLYSRLLTKVEQFPQDKYVAVDRRLIPFLSRGNNKFKFIDLAEVDHSLWSGEQLPLGSLASVLNMQVEDLITPNNSYIQADKELSEDFRLKLINPKKRVICGLSWYSGNKVIGNRKSIDLEKLMEYFHDLPLTFVDLQYGDTQDERLNVEKKFDMKIVHLNEVDNTKNLDGFAALVSACDIVVTISNTTAHIAGALGKKTILILPEGKGRLWYWADHDGKNIWYPSIEKFSQVRACDWSDPLLRIRGQFLGDV